LILRVEDPKEEKNPQGSSTLAGSDPKEEKNPQGFFDIGGTGQKGKSRLVLFRIHFIINKWCMIDRN
jgi:hypothetical protein